MSIAGILLVMAFILFVLHGIDAVSGRINLQSLGLALFVLAFIIDRHFL